MQEGMTPKEKRANNREAKRLVREGLKKQRWDAGFSNMDSRILGEIPDDYLADLQARYGPQTGPYLRADHQWQRRLTKRVVRSSIWASVIGGSLGIIGAIAGVIVGWLIGRP